jgi:hypothetical protein
MKSAIVAVLILLLWPVSALWAQGYIGLYVDPAGTDDQYEDTVPGLVDVYVFLMGIPEAKAVRFSAPLPPCLQSMVYLGETSPYLSIGDSQTGISISFGGPCLTTPVHVLTIHLFAQAMTNTCCPYYVLPDPAAPSGQIEIVDCSDNTIYGTGGLLYVSDGTYPKAENPSPPSGATEQPFDTKLGWTMERCSYFPQWFSYVHFGTTPDPPYVYESFDNWMYDPGQLSPETTYYWKIGTSPNDPNAPVWNFTTYAMPPRILVTEPYTITHCPPGGTFVVFDYDITGVNPPLDEVRGYEVTFSVDPAVAAVTGFIEGPYLQAVRPTFFEDLDNGGGSYTVVCSILGGTSGATGGGTLFRVDLDPVAEGIGNIAITGLQVRDVDNNPILVLGEDGIIQVDCTPPMMEAIVEPEDQYYNVPPSFSTFGFYDDVNLDRAEYQSDADGWSTLFSDIDMVLWDDDGFTLPAAQFDALTEGPHELFFRVWDDAGNKNGEGPPDDPDTFDWRFIVDRIPPTMRPIAEAQGQYYRVAPSFSSFGFNDDRNLDLAEYQIDSDGWNVLFSGIDAVAWDDDGFTLPGFGALSEGSHTVYFRVRDDAGNESNYSWQFYKDVTAPGPPTDFTALPGHEKVHLTWQNPQGDPTFAGVEIRRVSWGDYPQYSVAAPTYPANETEGLQVVVTSDESYDDDPVNPRDIYYYAAFAFDDAGNYTAFDAGAADRSTSYWLGDIDSTGTVDLSEYVIFSNAFGTAEGGPGWLPESDFGPTDDFSRLGVPVPDDIVDFEDLMILAMNYGNVSPAGATPLLAVETPAQLRERVAFELRSGRDGDVVHVSVVIRNEAVSLKGMRVVVDYGFANELMAVERGGLVAKESGHFFGMVPADRGKVDIGIAALGVDRPIEGSGEVARIAVRAPSSEPVRVRLEEVELRNIDNEGETVELPEEVAMPFAPTVSALLQNHPNPFNPTTVLTYDVATPGRVTIRIYDVAGRFVRTLVDAHTGVGRHRVEWDGLDATGTPVGSGIYFYRMTAPGYEPVARKMLLLK